MSVINIRGASGSGKSTLVHMMLGDSNNTVKPIMGRLGGWKKDKIIAYEVEMPGKTMPIYIIGKYDTQCGGCDSLSYKGSHDDIERMVREFMQEGNVIFEGLTISSTLTRWRRISDEFPSEFVWAFMITPEETCYERILARSGREPKRNPRNGLADYQIKYRGCMRHMESLKLEGQRVMTLSSDEFGYKTLVDALE